MTHLGVLLAKELRIEARSREMLSGGILLGVLVLILASLAWNDVEPTRVVPGALWIAFIFAGVLSMSRNLHRERDRGTWELLALLPVDWGTIFLAKAAASLVVLLIVQSIALPLVALLFDIDLWTPLPNLAPVLALGALGLAASGTLMAALSAHARAREVLLPLLFLPLLVPVLMMGVQATERVLAGATLPDVASELQILAAFDTIFLALGWLTFDHLLGD